MSIDPVRLYIGGQWRSSTYAATIAVIDPATEEQIGTTPVGTVEDVAAAVAAARSAFPGWSRTPLGERVALLDALADELERRAPELAALITAEVGTPARAALRLQAALPVTDLRTVLGLVREGALDDDLVGNSILVREAAGVVAAITPWNYPLHQAMCKLAPALASGCTVVLKPSEVAPLSIRSLVEAIDTVGFPPGVVNLVSGYGPQVGEALVEHPDVDVVSFTGSLRAGAQVGAIASRGIKRVTLELGGKSANVALEGCDLATVVKVGVANAFLNGGQTCTAWTRLLVPRARLDEAAELAGSFAEAYVPGDPTDPATRLGPMASREQRDRVRGHIAAGQAGGARLVTGGTEAPAGLDRGFYVRPTVFADVDPDSALAQEEIFGPVLSVLGYRDEDDAVAIANNSRFGLHGAVWSGDQERSVAFARRLRTGQVDVEGAAYNPLAPFGGFKLSGVGRELGRMGLEEFVETKSIQV